MAAVIFLAAGRFDYWQGWVFLGLTVGLSGDDDRHSMEQPRPRLRADPARAGG
ncbi:MAG: hypothetical protein M0C28_46235 [Candidatus Moduliflexus flocculans]|nr:hypothetical protein [Candidatus Moduliflexus flocculans]